MHGFADEIADTKVLDPACGSGNFLYVALRELLDLEKEVIALSTSLGFPLSIPTADPRQLYGIEINEYAHELAQATVWIGYIQWLHENGFGWPAEPLLKKLDNIEHKDAILAFDADGNPVEPEWPEATVVIGNPPFLGGKQLRAELGDDVRGAPLRALRRARPGTSRPLLLLVREGAGDDRGGQRCSAPGSSPRKGIRGGANRESPGTDQGDRRHLLGAVRSRLDSRRCSRSRVAWSASMTAARRHRELDGLSVASDQRRPDSRS